MSTQERFAQLQAPMKLIASKLAALDGAHQAYTFATSNPEFVLITVDCYTSLIRMIPNISAQDFARMPQTQGFLRKFGFDRRVPTPEEMIQDPKWNRHCPAAREDLATRMTKAAANKQEPGKYPEDETIYFGTLVKNPQAYIIGALGHIIERQIVAAVPSQKEPWQKDDVLHAMNELVMLRKFHQQPSPLFEKFTKSHAEGGLSWITPAYLAEFNQQLANPQEILTPDGMMLSAFDYFGSDRIFLDGLVRLALASGCPNPNVAQGVLLNLVERGLLSWHKDASGKVYFERSQLHPDSRN